MTFMTTRLLTIAILLLVFQGWCYPLQAMEPGVTGPASSIAVQGQATWPNYPSMGGEHDITRGPGGYLSWIKLLAIVAVFFFWVRLAEWVNKDAVKFSEHTGMPADIWNPLILFSFVAGFLGVLSIPVFIAGFPVYVVAAVLPYVIYRMQRRGTIPEEAMTGKMFAEDVGESAVPIEIRAAGDGEASSANLIRARQSAAYDPTCQMLLDAFQNRTEQILFDFTREIVNHRIQVDGIWHAMPPMDREAGDATLWVLKTLAGLNPSERRQTQKGIIGAKVGRDKPSFEVTSQGVPTGERVLVKIIGEATVSLELPELGMSPEMTSTVMEKIKSSGTVIISAPPGQGLTSTWQGVLNGSDRFTRDFVGVADHGERETERENIEIQRINIAGGESPVPTLQKMILKEPSAFVMPNLVNSETVDLLTEQVVSENRTLVTRVAAGSATEAVLRLMQLSGDRQRFVRSVTAVTCQRLVRCLCDSCKVPVQANPQAIQQMGGDPRVNTVLFRDYQLPPVEQRVDEQGKPVEMTPCPNCTGIGFRGRTAIYELLLVDNAIREVLLKTPKMDLVNQIARKQGNLTIIQQGYRAVLDGKTSVAEIQRVLQPRK